MKAILVLMCITSMFSALSAQTPPEWTWATNGGGTSLDRGEAIVQDGEGNTYVTGWFRNSITFADSTLSGNAGDNAFIVKYSPAGALIWLRAAAGGIAMGIGVDNFGNVLIGGYFNGTGTFGDQVLTSSLTDIFVAKMDQAGNWLWAVQGGGTGHDYCKGLTIDGLGKAYIVGEFRNTATFGSHSITSAGSTDIVVARVNADGEWAWAIRGGGSSEDLASGIAVRNGYCYISGNTYGGSFGSTQLSFTTNTYTLAGRITVNGSWIWASRAGGTHSNHGNAICVDNQGNSYVTGRFNGTASFSGSQVTIGGSYSNTYIAACSPMGLWYSVSTAGGSGLMEGLAITVDNYGNCYLAGYYQYNATLGDISLPNATTRDVFIAKLSDSGQWEWASRAGGNAEDKAQGIVLDDNGHCYITEYCYGTASFGDFQVVGYGNDDVFIAKHGGVPIYLAAPELLIENLGSAVRISWDPVPGATYYRIFAMNEPCPDDWGDPIGQTSDLYFDDPVDGKRFYRVTAVN